MGTGSEDIAVERRRQIEAEGWSDRHDDAEPPEALALAAVCYATPEDRRAGPMTWWPWAPDWWKPGDRRRELVKAGALIAAEIDRLDRCRHNT